MIADGILSGIAPTELYSFLAIVLAGLAAWKLVLGIQVSRKELKEIPATGLQPQPFLTKRAEEVVMKPDFEKTVQELKSEIGGVEDRIEKKLASNEKVFRDRFHELSNSIGTFSQEALNGREIATAQFKEIEGQIGGLKSTTEHTNALAIRTDQAVRQLTSELPKQIADALTQRRRA